jgi:hypothetical protein
MEKKLHAKEFHDVYFSPVIISVMKQMGMRWEGDVARMEGIRRVYTVLVRLP